MSVRDYLSRDHERLDALLAAGDYEGFRRGLLRHIGIEEKILFPLLGRSNVLVQQLHRDHAALGALLVPPPDEAIIRQIRTILEEHNPLEEAPGGLYDRIPDDVLDLVTNCPYVPVAPHADTPLVRKSIEELLEQRKR